MNEEIGAKGTTEKKGKAEQQPKLNGQVEENRNMEAGTTRLGLKFDKMIKNRGKTVKALLESHGRTEDGMCIVEKVMSLRGKGENKEVLCLQ